MLDRLGAVVGVEEVEHRAAEVLAFLVAEQGGGELVPQRPVPADDADEPGPGAGDEGARSSVTSTSGVRSASTVTPAWGALGGTTVVVVVVLERASRVAFHMCMPSFWTLPMIELVASVEPHVVHDPHDPPKNRFGSVVGAVGLRLVGPAIFVRGQDLDCGSHQRQRIGAPCSP